MATDSIKMVTTTVDSEYLDNFHLLVADQTGNNSLKFYCPQIDANAFNYDKGIRSGSWRSFVLGGLSTS